MNELYIPQRFIGRLSRLTVLPTELNGVLICSSVGNVGLVLETQILGGGVSDENTTHDRTRLESINIFLTENPRYRFVEFHTHTERTVQQYGGQYARDLSEGDKTTILDNYGSDNSYRHLLVTPETLRLYKISHGRILPANYVTIQDTHDQKIAERVFRGKLRDLEARLKI